MAGGIWWPFDISPALLSHLPDYRYRLTDLSAFTDAELRGGVLLQSALLVMKYIFQDELPERIPGILGLTGNTVDLRKTPSFRHGPPEPRLHGRYGLVASLQSGYMKDILVPHPWGGGAVQIGCPADLSGDPCRNDGCVNSIEGDRG